MNNLSLIEDDIEKTMTTKQLAEQLNTSPKVILENARKCLPNKIIENGKITYWNEKEITVLIEQLKLNQVKNKTFTSLVKVTSTELTPALKIKKAMELMQEGYEEELQILRSKINELTPKAEFFDVVTGSDDCIEMKEVAKILNYSNVGRNKLFEILRNKKILDRNNQPYQKYVDAGLFRIVESKYSVNGDVRINLKTVVFQKGLNFIRNIIEEV